MMGRDLVNLLLVKGIVSGNASEANDLQNIPAEPVVKRGLIYSGDGIAGESTQFRFQNSN